MPHSATSHWRGPCVLVFYKQCPHVQFLGPWPRRPAPRSNTRYCQAPSTSRLPPFPPPQKLWVSFTIPASVTWMMTLDGPPPSHFKETVSRTERRRWELFKIPSRHVKPKKHYPEPRSPVCFTIPKGPWFQSQLLRKCVYGSLIKHWLCPNGQTQNGHLLFTRLKSNWSELFPKIKLSH